MSGSMQRLHGGRAVSWRTVLGLALVPLTTAGVLLWGLWQPTERLESVTAAVVNLDDPVTVNGQLLPLGRVLAAELIAGDAETNFTWILTDEQDATQGLEDGSYASAVIIPKNFSAAATSLSEGPDKAEAATIDVRTSERGRLLDSAVSNIVTTTATSMLNEQLGSEFVSNVFVGMTQLGEGIGDAADGAGELSDGAGKLSNGAVQLSDGVGELASGAGELAGGAGELASGAGQLSDGAGKLASGTDSLAGGIGKLATGADELADGADDLHGGGKKLATGAKQAAEGGSELADGVEAYVNGINAVLESVIPYTGDGAEMATQLRALIEQIPDESWPAGADLSKQETLDTLDALIAELQAASSGDPSSQLVQVISGGNELAKGARASAKGQAELATGIKDYVGGVGELSDGLSDYASGVGAAASGAKELAAGASASAEGASQLADGSSTLAAGTSALADGTSQLADGSAELADGSVELADGSSALASGLRDAVAEIPMYTDAEAARMGELTVKPVLEEGGTDELFNAAGVPLFAGIALWAGAFASFLVLTPLWRRTKQAARGVGYITMRSALPAAGLGAVQGVIAGVVLPPLLGYSLSQGFAFFGITLLAGVAFSLVVQGLSALLGGFGRFMSFVLLVITLAVGVISTAPAVLQMLGAASPVGALYGGFQAIAVGTSGTGVAILQLVLWGLGGFALTAFAVSRARRKAGAY